MNKFFSAVDERCQLTYFCSVVCRALHAKVVGPTSSDGFPVCTVFTYLHVDNYSKENKFRFTSLHDGFDFLERSLLAGFEYN